MFELGFQHQFEFWIDRLKSHLQPVAKEQRHEVELGRSAEDIVPALCWHDTRPELRMFIPADLVVTSGAYAVAGGWHPFDAALKDGPEALSRFYGAFCPRDLVEMFFLERQGLAGEDLPAFEMPWTNTAKPDRLVAEKGLSIEHGVQWYGPASVNKVFTEYRRLQLVKESILAKGYLPDVFGDIVGYFFRAGDQYRFYAGGAKHRAAVLAHMGHERIPVMFRRGWPRVFDIADVAGWPSVRSGQVSRAFAEKVFRRYFEFDGSQQFDLLRLGSETSPASAVA